jgi:hypothetical protein
MTCGLMGWSPEPVGAASIASTLSMPSVTVPKTVCLPSSHGAASVVTMKNCEGASHDLVLVELVLERVAGATRAGALRAAALDHEVRDHPVEGQAVVEAVTRELAKVLDCLWRGVVEELDGDRPGICMKSGGGHARNVSTVTARPAPKG